MSKRIVKVRPYPNSNTKIVNEKGWAVSAEEAGVDIFLPDGKSVISIGFGKQLTLHSFNVKKNGDFGKLRDVIYLTNGKFVN